MCGGAVPTPADALTLADVPDALTLADVTAWGDPPEPQAATSHGMATTIPATHQPRRPWEDPFIASSSHRRSTDLTAV